MGIFFPVIWLLAGFTLSAGVTSLYVNTRYTHNAFGSFGVLAILVALDLAASGGAYAVSTLPLLQLTFGIRFGLSCLIFPAAIWFIGIYTRVRNVRYWATVWGAVYSGFLVAYISSAGSLFFTDWQVAQPLLFAGSSLHFVKVAPGPIWTYYQVANLVIFVWFLWRGAAMWRAGLHYKVWPLLIYMVIQLSTVVYDVTNNLQDKQRIPLAQFAFLGLVVIMGVSLVIESRRREEAFYKTVGALQVETAKRKRYEARLHYLATHDALTDLPNRRMLQNVLDTTLKKHQTNGDLCAIVFLDLDHFKTINASLGHQVGDKLLRLIAERLSTAIPNSRCVGRLGGDEFAVVLGNLGQDRAEAEKAAMQAADTLRDKLGEPFHVVDHQFHVGGSIGVAVFPDADSYESTDVGTMFRQADMALSRAKTTGRNRATLFASQMQQDARLHLVIEEGLHTAVDRGELELYFQPQLNVQGQLIGAEALLRWNHPSHGLIEPQQFIPVAEETGLIYDIGEFVLARACHYLHEWNETAMPAPPRVAINVSPWQLAIPDFARQVERSLMRGGVDPAWLTIEITESAVLQDIAEVTRTIMDISSLGVRFSIDDFGSGYSALASLKKLPLHELKIDRMFVSEMRMDVPDQFIRAIITMAENMGLYVIAEGVETEAQRSVLASLGCPGFQGYLISKPLNPREFVNWLQQPRPRPPPSFPH